MYSRPSKTGGWAFSQAITVAFDGGGDKKGIRFTSFTNRDLSGSKRRMLSKPNSNVKIRRAKTRSGWFAKNCERLHEPLPRCSRNELNTAAKCTYTSFVWQNHAVARLCLSVLWRAAIPCYLVASQSWTGWRKTPATRPPLDRVSQLINRERKVLQHSRVSVYNFGNSPTVRLTDYLVHTPVWL